MIEIEHKTPHGGPVVVELMQRDFGTVGKPDIHHKAKCRTCGAISETFPHSELEKYWPKDRGTVIRIGDSRKPADQVFDDFIKKSGELIRDSVLFGGEGKLT